MDARLELPGIPIAVKLESAPDDARFLEFLEKNAPLFPCSSCHICQRTCVLMDRITAAIEEAMVGGHEPKRPDLDCLRICRRDAFASFHGCR
jgi:hypothetical protein